MVSTLSDGVVSAQNQPLPQNIASGDHKDKDFIEVYAVPEPTDPTKSLRFLPSFSWTRIRRHLRPINHPFSSSHEAPDWLAILVHIFICILAALVTKLFVSVAPKRDLFWVRTIVHLNTLLVSLAINTTLLGLARPLLEAVAWATIVHRSQSQATGMDLKDIVTATEGSNDALAACRIFRLQISYNGNERRRRYAYDPSHWSIYIVFYLLAFTAAISTDFFLGRIIEIDTEIEHQNTRYSEVMIKGGISKADWTLAVDMETYDITLPSTEDRSIKLPWNETTVYFLENFYSLLVPNSPATCQSFSTRANTNESLSAPDSPQTNETTNATPQPPGIIRFSTWGTRIHCLKETSASNIMLNSSSGAITTVVSNTTLDQLFQHFNLHVPHYYYDDSNDTLYNQGLVSGISDSNRPMSLWSSIRPIGQNFFSVYYLAIGLNIPLAQSQATFLKLGPTPHSTIGLDAATCLEVYEPWVVEAQNPTFGFPTLLRVLEPGSNIGNNTGDVLLGKPVDGIPTVSSAVDLPDIVISAASSAYRRFDKETSGGTVNDPPEGVFLISETMPNVTVDKMKYNGISVQRLEEYLARTISRNILPYFSGCEPLLARSYEDAVVAHARPKWRPLYIFLAAIALIGVLAGLFVPKLPLGLPRRDFGAYSWLAAFHGGEMEGDLGSTVVKRGMHIREMEDTLGDIRFRYVV